MIPLSIAALIAVRWLSWGELPSSAPETHWAEIVTPTADAIIDARIFGADTMYILTRTKKLYHYRAGVWQQMLLPGDVNVLSVHLTAYEKIFIAGFLPRTYKLSLLEWQPEQERWQDTGAPLINNIRSMAFEDPEHGWATCDFGEILRYENGHWFHVYSPTRYHVEGIRYDQAGGIYAFTRYKERGQVLRWDGTGWHVWLDDGLPGIEDAIFLSEDNALLIGKPRNQLIYWDGDQLKTSPMPKKRLFFTNHPKRPQTIFVLYDQQFHTIDGGRVTTQQAEFHQPLSGMISGSDGTIWVYGAQGMLFRTNEQPIVASQQRFDYRHRLYTAGIAKGGAFVQATSEQAIILAVEHESQNNVIVFGSDGKAQFTDASLIPASKYGLDEPQRNWKGEVIYDHSVLAADVDNDGHEDVLLVAYYDEVRLFRNRGDGRFADITEWAGLDRQEGRFGIAATADIDNDGDLDLFIPNEVGPSRLLLNDGYGRFNPAPENAGIDLPHAAKGAAFADIDGDGWIDLAITTFGEGSFVFRNLGDNRFEDITHLSPALQPDSFEKCVSLTFADYDNDGDFDLYISKLGSSNALLQNDGSGRFHDVTLVVGLNDSALSNGAVFFDFDNDGHLDLFVANRGSDFFFLNRGDGTFKPAHEVVNGDESPSWLASRNLPLAAGGYSTGAIVYDEHRDGNLDLLILSMDARSRIVNNEHHNRNFLTFGLEGTRANRSAIGAVATLYPAGRLGESSAVLGARMIESVSGFGSHSEKLLHFGVQPDQRYDVAIRFPGGETVVQRDLVPGSRRVVRERRSGFALVWQQLRLLVNGYRADERTIQFLLFLCLLLGFWLVMRRRLWWQSTANPLLAAVMLAAIYVVHQTLELQSRYAYVLLPLLPALLLGIAFVGGWRLWRLYAAPNASIEALSLKLADLGHSTALANLMSRLQLQLVNMPVEGKVEAELVRRFVQTSRDVRTQIGPELQAIAGYQYAIHFESDRAADLLRLWARLERYLHRIEAGMQDHLGPKAGVLAQARDDLQALREHLRYLRRAIARYEASDVAAVAENARRLFHNEQVRIVIAPPAKSIRAHVPAGDLGRILTELFANAERAMQQSHQKLIFIDIGSDERRVTIDVRDTGCGLSAVEYERIFDRDFSTRDGGGLGLYSARQVLARYNGHIYVRTSKPGEGTTIRLVLQVAAGDARSQSEAARANQVNA